MSVYCIDCKKVFLNRSNLNKHRRVVHKMKDMEYNKEVGIIKCLNGCKISFKYNTDLRKHLEKHHGIETEVLEKKFASYDEFEAWLKIEEQKNNIRYQKSTGTKRSGGNVEKFYFNCVRSGKERLIPKETLKRNSKSQGSSKMNIYCTSQVIITKSETGECLMKYFKKHYGHGQDIQHLRLSKATREGIASKLIMGVSTEHIVDSNRENITQLKRDDLLTKEDIKNIKNSFNIHLKDGYRHTNDATSVDLWVKELSESEHNPVLFYKRQSELSLIYSKLKESDFCLILMNNVQSDLLSRFGKNVICVDGTHGLNPYDFELTTILVIDEFGEGFPTCFMFSNRKDTYINVIFFEEIKKIVGTIDAKVFMSDITNVYCNAWQNVMGPAEKELFCAWHVDRAWQQNLSKIANTDSRKWVYKTLKYLQTLLDESEFEKSFHSFLNNLCNESETRDMFNYIESHYLNNTHKWAYCYRKDCRINTNMYIESIHRVIKYVYLDGKKVRRLDKSLNALQKFIRNKIIDRVIKLTKGKSTEHSKLIHARHRSASLSTTFEVQHMDDGFSYLLKNNGNKEYLVSKNNVNVCCELGCQFCQICVHTFDCTCLDYIIKHTICIHIHYICLNVIKTSLTKNDNSKNKLDEVGKLLENVSTCPIKEQSHEAFSNEVKAVASKIITDIEINHLSMDDLKLVMKNLRAAALISSKNNDVNIIKFNDVEDCISTQGNMKNEKQTFFSTKKKPSKRLLHIKKPDVNESKIIKEYLTTSLFVSNDPGNDHSYI